jgi:hypothetical protein
MAFKDSLTAVSYYTQFDPYTYVTDNRPLVNLHDRDDAIADELDKRVRVIDVSGSTTPVVNQIPAGWTMVRNSVGDYTFTHGFNTLNYVAFFSATETSPYVTHMYAKAINSFSIKTVNLASVLTDIHFSCMVSRF